MAGPRTRRWASADMHRRGGKAITDSANRQAARAAKGRTWEVVFAVVVIGIIVLLIGNQRYQTALQTARQRLLAEERAASSTCTISDIGLDGLTSRVEGNYVYVSGRLINRCDSPTGVQVKVTLYDAAGNVLYSWDGWPASVSNVGPKSDYPFTTMVDNVHGWDRMDVRVIEVRKW